MILVTRDKANSIITAKNLIKKALKQLLRLYLKLFIARLAFLEKFGLDFLVLMLLF